MKKKNKNQKNSHILAPVMLILLAGFFLFGLNSVSAAENAPTPIEEIAKEVAPPSYINLDKALNFELKGKDFAYFLDSRFDLKSFMNKPVRLPVASDNPDGIPGGDEDFLYIYPPEFYFSPKTGKISVIPSKIMYFASGQSVNENRVRYLRSDLQKKVAELLQEKKTEIESLKAVIVKQQSKRYQTVGLLITPDKKIAGLWGQVFSLPVVHAEGTDATELTNLVSDLQQQISNQSTDNGSLSEDDAIEQVISSDDSKTREMLSLLLLLLIYKNAMAEPVTDLKAQCLAVGGEWLNEKCSVDSTTTSETNSVTALGTQKICEESGGTWKAEYPLRKVCMARCEATDDKCTESILAEEVANKGCVCPEGACVTAVGDCLMKDSSKEDKDEDEIPDGTDKCPNSKDVSSGVSMNEQSENYGCTCSDLQARGKIQQRQCPGSACDGYYMVTYAQSSGTDYQGIWQRVLYCVCSQCLPVGGPEFRDNPLPVLLGACIPRCAAGLSHRACKRIL